MDLFDQHQAAGPWQEALSPDTHWLHAYLVEDAAAILRAVDEVVAQAPYRHLSTPGGKQMSVAMSNCGELGWVSDRRGYRYQADDPLTGQPWPPMPELLRTLAQQAARDAGYTGFSPTVCLINRYQVGARMGLHQDRDEDDFAAPIVSFSLGLPATFIWGRTQRGGKTHRFPLSHGDALVWGGADRLVHHGVAPLKPGHHPLTGDVRINITFRQTGA